MDHLSQELLIGELRGRHRSEDTDAAQRQQVAQQDTYDAHGKVGVGREFGDRKGLVLAQGEQGQMLGRQGGVGSRAGLREDQRYEVEPVLARGPVLAQPNIEKPFDVFCDTSKSGLGCVLIQDGRVIAYAS
jgi:hypothetical protein